MPKLTIRVDARKLTPGQIRLLQTQASTALLAGGFGSGKTTAGAIKTLQLKAMNPGVPGLIAAQSWSQLWSVTVRTLLDVVRKTLPREYWPRLVDKTGECYLDFGDGVPVFLRTASKPSSMDGTNAGWGWGDEVRHWPKESYDTFIGRVRMPCPLPQKVFTSTPSMGWMSDEFNSGKTGRELITAPTRENLRNLAPNYLEDLRVSYSPRLQRAILDGLFTILEGAVFEAFDPLPQSPWFVDYAPNKDRLASKRVFIAYDPGFRRSAWLWLVEESPLEWVVFDELGPENTSTAAQVDMANARKWPVHEVWTDPAADATEAATGIDTLTVLRTSLRTVGLSPLRTLVDFTRDITFGIDKTRVLLGGYEGLPVRIKFARRLFDLERGKARGIIRDLAAYKYPEVKDGRPITDKPEKDGTHDHFCDCIRYWSVGQWTSRHELRKRDPAFAHGKAGYRVA